LTDIVQGQKKEVHLCQQCAEEQQLIQHQDLNLSMILQTVIGPHVGSLTDALARLTCPTCGIKYMEFRAAGRLGCPHDYQVFHAALKPLLKRIHRRVEHRGKVPQRARQSALQERRKAQQVEILKLRCLLQTAIEEEKYEEAARLRDLIRQMEAMYESG
jgi:protein arginine kinase activator